jgi:hypothetical protein
MAKIEEVFFLPPMAVARLGGSDIPLASFTWSEDPSLAGAGLTVITPEISLEVLADGSVRPFRPASIQFRDGKLLRPVAPFFELWVRSDGEEQPLTLKWLLDQKADLANITYTVTAGNRKAARRTGDAACAYSATVTAQGDDHTRHALPASSTGENPLVSADNPIPLGHFQVIRPVPTIAMGVDLSVSRVRFIPARGLVYGPPNATTASETDDDLGREHELVPLANRTLNPNASWMHYTSNGREDSPEPADTYDGADDSSRRNRSFGVVDDTCDVLLHASITIGGKKWEATARAFSAPPDFAPDRRPFYSLAEELTDRDPPPRESAEALPDAMERLGDLFQRVFETSSLANLDMMRNDMLPRSDRGITNFPGLPAVSRANSMTPRDTPFFDRTEDLNSPPSSHEKLPYVSVAQAAHAPLANTDDLALYLRTRPEHVRQLIRPAFAHFKDLEQRVNPSQKPNPGQRDPRIVRDGVFDMRMPPYMRDSDATPLSLNRRQYEFLMETLDRLQPTDKAQAAAVAITPTQEHVARVAKRRASAGNNAPANAVEKSPKRRAPSGKKRRKN